MEAPKKEISILLLPNELLFKIFSEKCLLIEDLCHLQCVCKRFKDIIITSQLLWREKILFQYSWIWQTLFLNFNITDWIAEVKLLYKVKKRCKHLVESLSSRLFSYNTLSISVLNDVRDIMNSCVNGDTYFLFALRSLYINPRQDNLTHIYYAIKVYKFISIRLTKKKWQCFFSLPEEEQILEKAAMLPVESMLPFDDNKYNEIEDELTKIAYECFNILKASNQKHPLIEEGLILPLKLLKKSLWKEKQCQEIFKIVNNVLFDIHNFRGPDDEYDGMNISFLHYVLKNKIGIPITLCIIYKAICHRLGILLEPVNYSSNCLLLWKVPETEICIYIDVVSTGRQMSYCEVSLKAINEDVCSPSTSRALFQRVCTHCIDSTEGIRTWDVNCLEIYSRAVYLSTILFPNEERFERILKRVHSSLGLYYDDQITHVAQYAQDDPPPLSSVLRREGNCTVRFATGLVMKHRKYHYTCVITGWNEECTMPEHWVIQMNVYSLKYKKAQPFYNVLGHDGSSRYAAQENLELLVPAHEIFHPKIGKYFKAFDGAFYVPNDEMNSKYPDDEEVRNEFRRFYT